MTSKFIVPVLIGILVLSAVPALAQGTGGASTSSGTSRAFNPAISLNGLFLFSAYPNRPTAEHEEEDGDHEHEHGLPEAGMDVQEVEIRFTAEIDPYSRADATVAFHGEEVHLEEVVVSSRVLGHGFGLRAGKMFVDTTSENLLHTHEFPFVRRSLINQYLFSEPYTDVGFELSYLLPLTPYVELKGVVLDGKDEGLFQVDEEEGGVRELEGGDLAYNTTLYTLFDLNESSTLGFVGRWLGGPNTLGENSISQVASASAVYRWIPTRTNRFKSVKLHGEYVWSDQGSDDPMTGGDNSGWFAYAQYQFSRRWYLGARYGTLARSFTEEAEAFVDEETRRATAQLAFTPSEFQLMRLEYSYVSTPEADWSEIFLQFNFTIGSHPAHRY